MINRDNYHAVKDYLNYQSEVLQRDLESIKRKWLWLRHLLIWADDRPLAQAAGIRPVYPRYLVTAKSGTKGDKSLATIGVTRCCQEARSFFHWARQADPRQYRDVTAAWVETLYPPRMNVEPRKDHQAVTIEMVRELLQVQVAPDDMATRRDKAAAAFLFLSGARATAFCTLTLECVNIGERTVKQYPTMGVRTKNRKAAETRLLEIPDLIEVVTDWDGFVRSRLPATAPWYPVIDISLGEQRLTADAPGRYRAYALADNMKALFERAGLVPMSPHKFRHGHAVYGLKLAKEVGDLKAVSMNLMHSSIGITDSIYAVLSDRDMQQKIARLGQSTQSRAAVSDERIKAIVSEVLERLEGEQVG